MLRKLVNQLHLQKKRNSNVHTSIRQMSIVATKYAVI